MQSNLYQKLCQDLNTKKCLERLFPKQSASRCHITIAAILQPKTILPIRRAIVFEVMGRAAGVGRRFVAHSDCAGWERGCSGDEFFCPTSKSESYSLNLDVWQRCWDLRQYFESRWSRGPEMVTVTPKVGPCFSQSPQLYELSCICLDQLQLYLSWSDLQYIYVRKVRAVICF